MYSVRYKFIEIIEQAQKTRAHSRASTRSPIESVLARELIATVVCMDRYLTWNLSIFIFIYILYYCLHDLGLYFFFFLCERSCRRHGCGMLLVLFVSLRFEVILLFFLIAMEYILWLNDFDRSSRTTNMNSTHTHTHTPNWICAIKRFHCWNNAKASSYL